tara:strand:- start:242 stop:982 length:741 start_codon:yes stop_codon:yes gene_type:complete
MIVLQTDHFVNKIVTDCFALGSKAKLIKISDLKERSEETLVSYGILRGTGEVFKKAKNFYYIDHGYLSASKRAFVDGSTVVKNLDGYFRVVKNDFIEIKKGKFDSKRLNELDIKFKPKRKSGEFIILSEPSEHIKEFFKINNWIEKTYKELKNFTDRKILIHNKQSKISLDELLQNAWAFVSFQSAAGFKAMIQGIPAHFTYDSLKNINPIKNIESGIIDYQIFNNMAYSQWTLKEFSEGKMMDYI